MEQRIEMWIDGILEGVASELYMASIIIGLIVIASGAIQGRSI